MNNEEFKRRINERNINLGLQAKTRKDKSHDGQRGKDIDAGRDGEANRGNDAGKRAGIGVRGEGCDREAAKESRQDTVCADRRGGPGDLPGGVDNGVAQRKRGQRQRPVTVKKTLGTA